MKYKEVFVTGSEFIEKLKKALENDLSEAQVREQTAFYSSYIREEVRGNG